MTAVILIDLGFRIYDMGFGISGLGFRVWDFGFRFGFAFRFGFTGGRPNKCIVSDVK